MANKADIICAEKYWTDSPMPLAFNGKRWRLNKACELRSTVVARKTHNKEVVLPKDYLT